MPGFGSSGFGVGPAGQDPLASPFETVTRERPQALHYQPADGDAVVLSNGQLQADHWVDAWMDLNLSVPRGSLRSSPTVGHTLREIKYLTSTLDADVRDRIASAAAPRVNAGDVRIDSIDVIRQKVGFVAVISYTNLRLASQPQRVVRTSI